MKIAAITMVYDEDVFLPLWLNHYGACFGLDNLYVIDDGSTDGSTSDHRIRNLVAKRRSPLDEDDRATLVSAFHQALLGFYDVVIYTDVDELIVVDPDLRTSLAEYIRANDFSCRAPIGFEVVHRRAREAGIDFTVPLFRQRRFVRFDRDYTKPLIARRPIRWRAGFHHCDLPYQTDCNLVLFHLRSVDYAISMKKIALLNSIRFSDNSIQKQQSTQFRLDPARYLTLLYGADDREFEGAPEREPDAMFHAKRETDDRSLSRLNRRWSETIRFDRQIEGKSPTPTGLPDGQGLQRMFDAALERMIRAEPSRTHNDPCPCGSGRRFKHCHGAELGMG